MSTFTPLALRGKTAISAVFTDTDTEGTDNEKGVLNARAGIPALGWVTAMLSLAVVFQPAPAQRQRPLTPGEARLRPAAPDREDPAARLARQRERRAGQQVAAAEAQSQQPPGR